MLRLLLGCFLSLPLFSSSQLSIIALEVKPIPLPVTRDTAVDNWNLLQPGFNTLSSEAKDFLYWVNYCRRNPERFWDSVACPILLVFPALDRIEAGSLKADLLKTGALPMFALNRTLTQTAQLHASDIADQGAAPSHTSTDGTDFGQRMKKAGIKYCASENISLCSQGSLLAVLLLYLDLDLPHLSHRKSLLNPIFVETGVGAAAYGKDQFFLVQDLACSQQ